MSSDIILEWTNASSRGKYAAFTRRPFLDICDRVQKLAIDQGRLELAELAGYAKVDNYFTLDLPEWDQEGLALIEKAVNDALSDPDFFSWQADGEDEAIFIEQCRVWGTTPSEQSVKIREFNLIEMNRLIGFLREVRESACSPLPDDRKVTG